eukprot:COSAG01_NODE_5038_length_4532_cov_1.902323_6_plen_272_part_01
MKSIYTIHLSKQDQAFIERKLEDTYDCLVLDSQNLTRAKDMGVILLGDDCSHDYLCSQIKYLKSNQQLCEIIFCSRSPKISHVVDLLKLGLYDVLQLPAFASEIIWLIEKANELLSLQRPLLPHRLSNNSVAALQQDLDLSLKNTATKPVYFAGKPTILLVEDDELIRKNYAQHLNHEFNILEAPDAKTALAQVAKHSIQVLILDIGLPDQSGDRILKQLKSMQRNMEVLVVTAYRDIELVTHSIKSGAHDYLIKKSDLQFFKTKVMQSLQK